MWCLKFDNRLDIASQCKQNLFTPCFINTHIAHPNADGNVSLRNLLKFAGYHDNQITVMSFHLQKSLFL